MDNQTLIASVRPYYPWPINIFVENDLDLIKQDLNSKGVDSWAQGPIPGTEAFKLLEGTASSSGVSIKLVIICSQKDVEIIRSQQGE